MRRMETRVIGIGNPLRGDDGIGPAAVEWVRREPLPDDVQIRAVVGVQVGEEDDIQILDGGEASLGLVGLMEDADRVVLVDAAEMGAEPGAVRVFDLSEVLLAEEGVDICVHSARTASAIRLAASLGCLPRELKFVGVQPKQMGWGIGLSPEVSRALPTVAKAVLGILGLPAVPELIEE